MSNNILEVTDLNVRFKTHEGTAHVLKDINIEIQEGETLAIVGETGCGKSLTTKTIMDLVPTAKTKGTVKFNGEEILSNDTDLREDLRGDDISLIMQDPMSSLNPVFTIGEQMIDLVLYQSEKKVGLRKYVKNKFSSGTREEAREEAISILEEVQIPSPERTLESYPHQLSGGMRQRVLIGMALISDPKLLIADEPGTALDVTTEAKIIEILDDIVEEYNKSVLYITHDLGVAKKISDKVNVMHAGQVIEKSPTNKLFQAPKHPYTRTLLDSVPSLSRDIGDGAEGYIPSYVDVTAECRFADRCPHAEEECRNKYPGERLVGDKRDHSVVCHLYPPVGSGKNLQEKGYIGPAPWEEKINELK